ncbi:MAG: hypothetical protein IKI04_01205 [Bacilli bacterium]|nr:hypothetical protein [Bacilli bacterium]
MDDSKILESRKITKEEYNLIIALISKYKLNSNNFINNSKTLLINKIDYNGMIYNGYNPEKNIINYNESSNLIRELLHVASSNKSKYQGICIKPNRVYPESLGIGLNEGISDMFLELYNKEEGYFPFEKICAKTLKYVYTVKLFHFYFTNNDGSFRHYLGKNIASFLLDLDEYMDKMLYAKYLYQKNGKIGEAMKLSIKVLMTVVINDLFKLIGESNKEYKNYLFKQLNGKSMKPIYNIIGEYDYSKFNR